MSKTPEQISNLCAENDKLRELWRIRDAIVDAALKWGLVELKGLRAKHIEMTQPKRNKHGYIGRCDCSECRS